MDNNNYSCVQIYTDASKNLVNRIGISFMVPEFNVKKVKRISDGLSVFRDDGNSVGIAMCRVGETFERSHMF